MRPTSATVRTICFILALCSALLLDICTLFLYESWVSYAVVSLFLLHLFPLATPFRLGLLAAALAIESPLWQLPAVATLLGCGLLIGAALGAQRFMRIPRYGAPIITAFLICGALLWGHGMAAGSYLFGAMCGNLMVIGTVSLTVYRCGSQGDRS